MEYDRNPKLRDTTRIGMVHVYIEQVGVLLRPSYWSIKEYNRKASFHAAIRHHTHRLGIPHFNLSAWSFGDPQPGAPRYPGTNERSSAEAVEDIDRYSNWGVGVFQYKSGSYTGPVPQPYLYRRERFLVAVPKPLSVFSATNGSAISVTS
eukprot:2120599-Rhodomonas_salina.2